jgi:NADP-dependent 3-hydroxy acid dehydrogenase YdfG
MSQAVICQDLFKYGFFLINSISKLLMNRLVIVGATGVLGSAATKYFLQKNFSVKAFVRNIDKAAALEKQAQIFLLEILPMPHQ